MYEGQDSQFYISFLLFINNEYNYKIFLSDGYGGTQDLSASVTSKDGLVMGADSSHQSLNAGAFKPDHNKSVLHQRQHSDPLSKEDLEMYSRIGQSFINCL